MNNLRGLLPLKAVFMVMMVCSGAFFGNFNILADRSEGPMGGSILDIYQRGDWTVSTTEVYTDERIYMEGNLTVTGNLTLDNCELIFNTSHPFYPRFLEIGPGGGLIVRNGSMITADSRSYSISADTGSSVTIDSSVIENCGLPSQSIHSKGIFTRSNTFKLIDSEIRDCEGGILSDGARVTIYNSNVTRMSEFSLIALNGTVLNATLMRAYQSPGKGILSEGSFLMIERSTFTELELSLDTLNSSVDVRNSTLSGFGPYCCRFNSTTGTIQDSAPFPMGGDRLFISRPAGASSRLLLLNSTFMGVTNADPHGDVKEGYRFDVKVMTNKLMPAEKCDVEIKDVTGKMVFQGLTGPEGCINDIPVATRVYNVSGGFPLSPHNISVMYEGATRYGTVDVSSYHFILFSVIRSHPEVIVEYPRDDQWINVGSFDIVGEVNDPRPVTDIWMSLDGSQEFQVPRSTPFAIPLVLPDGPHTVRIVAKNDDGLYGNRSVSFGVDTIAPEIIVNSPSSPYFTNRSNVWILGSCSEDADLFIAGEKVPHKEGSFTTMVLLSEGRNDILIRALDRAGNTASETLIVNYDPDPPYILVFSPPNGTRTNIREIMLRGVTDPDTQHLWVNGHEIELVNGEFEVLVSGLSEGINHIKIQAQDLTGSIGTRDLVVIVDTQPPSLIITEAPSLTDRSSVIIKGRTDPGAIVMVNGKLAEVKEGLFTSLVELLDGSNNITISASDDLGNRRSVYRYITLDTVAPMFGTITPSNGSELTNPIIEIKGSAFDEMGIRSIRAKINDGIYVEISREEEFSWITSLVNGPNVIDMEAEDRAGNTAFLQLSYTYRSKVDDEDHQAPTIVVTSPLSNTTLITGRFTIEGWAMDNRELAGVHVRINGGEWMEVNGSNNWNIEVEFPVGKIYLIEARAMDASDNEDIFRVWVTVIVDRSGDDDEKGSVSSGTMIIFIAGIMILLIAIVFGYLLMLRNQNLRQQLEKTREENSQRKLKVARRSAPGGRQGRNGPISNDLKQKPSPLSDSPSCSGMDDRRDGRARGKI
ncbi:MAG: hypothetical protein JXA22_01150 [Candidatus Thermoplasmatota archaeon]|nr:hypothetical protein [Candidatus Thermoplasmatota archaeon]